VIHLIKKIIGCFKGTGDRNDITPGNSSNNGTPEKERKRKKKSHHRELKKHGPVFKASKVTTIK